MSTNMDEIDSIIEAEQENNLIKENVKSLAAGGFGGICAVLTGHPFDLVKVLLQTGQHKTLPSAFTSILKTSGPVGFYRGVSSPLIGVTPIFAVSFWGYDVGKKLVYAATGKKEGTPLSIAEISAAGFFSAIPTTLLTAPFDRIKVVMQVSTEKLTFNQTVVRVYKQGGIASIYKGSLATIARDGPGSAVYFATYEILKKMLTKEGTDLSVPAIITAGGMAGVVMWPVIFPIDTIKSVQQSLDVKQGVIQVTKNIYAQKGLKGFFPGLAPAMLRAFPANAATFLGVELAKNFLNDYF